MAREKKKKETEKTEKANTILVGTRGRIFQGKVVRRFPRRITIEWERTLYIPKYERFLKKKSRLHARISDNADVKLGDLVKVQECRPLSKITKFMFIEKVASENSEATGDKK